MRFPFDVHSIAFTYLSLSSGRGKLYYTILYLPILYLYRARETIKLYTSRLERRAGLYFTGTVTTEQSRS